MSGDTQVGKRTLSKVFVETRGNFLGILLATNLLLLRVPSVGQAPPSALVGSVYTEYAKPLAVGERATALPVQNSSGQDKTSQIEIRMKPKGDSDNDDDDTFIERLVDPDKIDAVIQAVIESFFQNPTAGSVEYSDDILREVYSFLRDLYTEISLVLASPRELAQALVGTMTDLGVEATRWVASIVIVYMIRRLRSTLQAKSQDRSPSPLTSAYKEVGDVMTTLYTYFLEHERSRISEIESATRIDRKKISAILGFGPFTHAKGCFWRLADSDVLFEGTSSQNLVAGDVGITVYIDDE